MRSQAGQSFGIEIPCRDIGSRISEQQRQNAVFEGIKTAAPVSNLQRRGRLIIGKDGFLQIRKRAGNAADQTKLLKKGR